jgi:hypothetical protein
MDLSGRFALRSKFANIDSVLPEEVAVAGSHAEHFHRPDDRVDSVGPACMSRKKNYSLVDTDRAVAAGVVPCRNCYEPVFEHLARQPNSPVEYRESEPDLEEVDVIDAEALADGGAEGVAAAGFGAGGEGNGGARGEHLHTPSPLTARTEKVRIKSGASKVYHAPAANGTLCGKRGAGYRSVRYASVEGHYRPCEECFDTDAVGEK